MKFHRIFAIAQFKKWCALLLASAFLCAFLPAQAADRTHLRVGYYALDGYQNLDENGALSGYGYDLLQTIARYEPVSYTYHGHDESIAKLLHQLERGELDIITGIKRTPDLMERFDFSDRRIAIDSTILTVREGNDRLVSGDYSTYNGIRIGTLQGSYRSAELAAFAKSKGFRYHLVNYQTTTELTQALQKGYVDAILSSSLRSRKYEWTLESFNESQLYIAVRKGDQKTLSIINHALNRMTIEEEHWFTSLQHKYHTDAHSTLPFFTQAEYDYLRTQREAGRVFKVLVNPDRYPYSYVEDGQMKGIMIDLFDMIAQSSHIDYEWMILNNREEYGEALNARSADICIDLTPDFYLGEQQGYTITDTYLTAPFSWIRRSDTTGNIQLAAKLIYMALTPAQYAYHDAYHDIEYITYATEEECLQSVLSGATDAYCTYTYRAEQIVVNTPGSPLMSTISQSENQFTIGISRAEDAMLASILNASVHSIEDWERVDIIRRHSALTQHDFTMVELIMSNRYLASSILLALLAIVLLIMLITRLCKDQQSLQYTVRKQGDRLHEVLQSMITVLATAIEFRSVESGDHVQRIRGITHTVMSKLSQLYPQEYNLSKDDIEQIALASVLHDVGKIAIPDHVLNKPGKLTSVEYQIIKQHPVKGCELLERIPGLKEERLYAYAWDICRWHHERWDGRGYPDALEGDAIPIWAQAAAVADVFDALTSPRVYKEAYSREKAVQMILNGECGAFNPKVMEAFRQVADSLAVLEAPSAELLQHAPANRDLATLTITAFQTLLDHAGSMVYLKDVDLVYRAVSPSFAALAHCKPEEMLTHTDQELLKDQARAMRYETEETELLASREAMTETLEMYPSSKELPACISIARHRLTDSQGRIMGILGICRDVTAEYYSKRHHHMELSTLFTLPGNAYFSVYVDVTTWHLIEENRHPVNGITFPPNDTIQRLTEKARQKIVDKTGPAYHFYQNFNPEALQELYHNGRNDITLEYRRYISGHEERWIRDEIRFMIMPSTGHLSLLLTVYDIHTKKLQEQQLIQRAERDPLTNMLNRASLQHLVEETLSTSDPEADVHAMFIIDLDDFKHINDTLGHMAGDECLRQLASTIDGCFRANDLVARIGGDEFAVFMRHVSNADSVRKKAERLRSALENLALSTPGSDHSASIGVSLYPSNGTTLDELYAKADAAMYQAKRTGKNRVTIVND